MIEITEQFIKERPLSASSLKAFGGEEGSPKKYIAYLSAEWRDTDATIIGKATESLIYAAVDKMYKFDEHFLLYDQFDKRSNEAKAKWQNMIENATSNKLTLVDNIQYEQAKKMADTALQTDETRYYLDRIAKDKDGRMLIQKKVHWKDMKTGLWIIGYIDIVVEIEGHFIIVDIKTDKDGGPGSFSRTSANYDNHIQVGSYLTGYHKMYYLFPDFMFMVLDKSDPYDAIMMHCPSDYCEKAKNEFAHLLTAFKHCMNEKQFHRGRSFWSAEMGYFNMDLPRYKKLKFTSE